MKTLEELKAFCEGYLACYSGSVDMDIGGADDWVVWNEYDINLTGCEYAQDIDADEWSVNAYPRGWTDNLPAPLFSFIINQKGEIR